LAVIWVNRATPIEVWSDFGATNPARMKYNASMWLLLLAVTGLNMNSIYRVAFPIL